MEDNVRLTQRKTFSLIASIKNKLSAFRKKFEEVTVKKLWESIYDKMDAWIEFREELKILVYFLNYFNHLNN